MSLFLISENYICYYIMIIVIVLANFHFIPVRYIKNFRIIERIILIIKFIIPLSTIFFVFYSISLNPYNSTNKNYSFIFTLDPIQQELNNSIKERTEILLYIAANQTLAFDFLMEVTIENKFNKYDFLINQIDTLLLKENTINRIYNNLTFNRNKKIYEHIIMFFDFSRSLKNELNRLQLVNFEKIIETERNQINAYIKENIEMLSLIEQFGDDEEIFETIGKDMINRIQEINRFIAESKINLDYLSSQMNINRSVTSEINKLLAKNNSNYEKIIEELGNEGKRMRR